MLTEYQMLQSKIKRLNLDLEVYESPTGYIITKEVDSRLRVMCRGDHTECLNYLMDVYYRSQGI